MGGVKHAQVSDVPLTCQDLNRGVGHGDNLLGPAGNHFQDAYRAGEGWVVPKNDHAYVECG